MEKVKIKNDTAYLYYDGFDLVSGDDGVPIHDFVYELDAGFVIEFLEKMLGYPIDELALPLLCEMYKDEILTHFFEEAKDAEIERLEKEHE